MASPGRRAFLTHRSTVSRWPSRPSPWSVDQVARVRSRREFSGVRCAMSGVSPSGPRQTAAFRNTSVRVGAPGGVLRPPFPDTCRSVSIRSPHPGHTCARGDGACPRRCPGPACSGRHRPVPAPDPVRPVVPGATAARGPVRSWCGAPVRYRAPGPVISASRTRSRARRPVPAARRSGCRPPRGRGRPAGRRGDDLGGPAGRGGDDGHGESGGETADGGCATHGAVRGGSVSVVISSTARRPGPGAETLRRG